MTLPFTLLFDPANPTTMVPPAVQLLAAGNTFQRGQRVAAESVEVHGRHYGLRFDDRDEIHSFPTLDGETLRWGVRDRNGLPMLVQRHQFIPAEGYQYQEGVRNTTTGPNSDRLRNDGIRSRWNCIPIDANDPIGWSNSFGDGTGSTVIMATIVEIPDWVAANDLNACLVGMHATDGGPASPFTSFLGQGKWRIVHRDSRVPLRAGSPPPSGDYSREVAIAPDDIGKRWAIVTEFLADPIVGRFRCWYNRGDGEGWRTLVDRSDGWGWGYGQGDDDAHLWGAILMGFYSWKNNGPPKVAPMNWDTRFPTREICYGPTALFVDEDVTPKAVGEWIEQRLADDPIVVPDPLQQLTAQVAQLQQQLADLEAEFEAESSQMRAAWSALKSAASGVAGDA